MRLSEKYDINNSFRKIMPCKNSAELWNVLRYKCNVDRANIFNRTRCVYFENKNEINTVTEVPYEHFTIGVKEQSMIKNTL